MKKLFVSLMIAGATLLSATSYAQTTTQSNAPQSTCCGKECSKDKKEKKECKKEGKKEVRKGEIGRAHRLSTDPFNGIELTADQQQRLQVLRQGLGPVMPQSYEKSDKKQELSKEEKMKLRQEKAEKKKDAKKNYLNGVKEILTPDQYVIFLENVYLYGNQDSFGKPKMTPMPKAHGDKGKVKERKREAGK